MNKHSDAGKAPTDKEQISHLNLLHSCWIILRYLVPQSEVNSIILSCTD